MSKILRVVALVICLAICIIGAILIEPGKGSEYTVTCGVLGAAALVVTAQFGYPVHVISIAFVLTLSGSFARDAGFATEDKTKAGYALMILGMWTGFLFLFEDTFDKIKAAVPSQLVTPPTNLVALVGVLLNWLGCILLWSGSKASGLADLGTQGFVSSILFIGGWFGHGPVANWISFFWFAAFQYIALGQAIGCGKGPKTSDGDLCQAGGTFLWIAAIVYLVLLFWVAKGQEFVAMLQSIPSKIKSIPLIILFICLIVAIIGACISSGANNDGWGSANAVAAVMFLIGAFLLNGSGDRETGAFLVAFALVITVSGDLVATADGDRRAGGNDKVAAGNVMMVVSMWLGFVAAAAESAQAGVAALTALLGSGVAGVIAILFAVMYWVGLALLWYCCDNGFPGFVGLSITCFLIFFVFFIAAYVKKGGVYTMITEFLVAYVHIALLSIPLSMDGVKDGTGPGEVQHADALRAGLVILWICQVLMIACCVMLLGTDPAAGTGGSAGGGQSGGSAPPAHKQQAAAEPKPDPYQQPQQPAQPAQPPQQQQPPSPRQVAPQPDAAPQAALNQ